MHTNILFLIGRYWFCINFTFQKFNRMHFRVCMFAVCVLFMYLFRIGFILLLTKLL
jgi:hypothetical protein